jgi:hypothetical protein
MDPALAHRAFKVNEFIARNRCTDSQLLRMQLILSEPGHDFDLSSIDKKKGWKAIVGQMGVVNKKGTRNANAVTREAEFFRYWLNDDYFFALISACLVLSGKS